MIPSAISAAHLHLQSEPAMSVDYVSVDYVPAEQPAGRPPMVLIHGWGHDRRCWENLVPHLSQRHDLYLLDLPGFGDSAQVQMPLLPDLLQSIAQRLPSGATLVGWSLGGHLALELARLWPQKLAAVVTIATNCRFVADAAWPHAMPKATFDAFSRGFAEDAELTLKRFAGLQAQGDVERKNVLKQLRAAATAPTEEQQQQWQTALDWLADFDHTEFLAAPSVPLLQLFGEADALVPFAAARALREGAPERTVLLTGAGHAPQLSQPAQVLEHLFAFVEALQQPRSSSGVDKSRMARSFSRAAATYDSVAHVQQEVGEQLLQSCPPIKAGARVLDLGCGTGFCTRYLMNQLMNEGAETVALDIAPGMLQQARGTLREEAAWICGDAEQLPFGPTQFDGIVSNLTIQWSQSLPGLFKGLQETLTPGGWLLFSTLGPNTLRELRTAWRAVDEKPHVNRFTPESELRGALHEAGLSLVRFDAAELAPGYAQVGQLMRELKALGAHNVANDQQRGLTTPADLRTLSRAYEAFRRCDGLLPATYQVYYVLAQRPA